MQIFEISETKVKLSDREVLICDIEYDRTILYNTNPASFGPLGEYEIVENKNNQIIVRANQLVIDTELRGEYIFEDNYFILMHGEEKIVKYRMFSS